MKVKTPGSAIFLSLLMLLPSCNEKPDPEISMKDELYVYLDSLEHRYEAACEATGLANWNSYSGDTPYNLDSAKALFTSIFIDSIARKTIEDWRNRSGSLADPLLGRRLELWHRCFLGGSVYADPGIASLENELQNLITNFTLRYNGKAITRAELNTRLRTERKQSRRKKLWEVTSQLSARAEHRLDSLVRLRNTIAEGLGFRNYYSLSLHLQAVDEAWLIATLNSLEEQTREPFRRFIGSTREDLGLEEFGPWDFDFSLRRAASIPDRYFPADSVFSVIHAFETAIGFPVDSLPITEVVRDIPYGGLSLGIRIPSDSRFLVNPTQGKNFYGVAFHEYGHSLKAVNVRTRYPILKGYEWIPGAQCAAYEEGVADLHREFTDDPVWLSAYTTTPSVDVSEYMASRNLPALYRLRRLMKDFFFEYEMYSDPDQDLTALEHAMYEKYLLTAPDSTEPHQYASSIWYTSYPCYYQNYILAAMIATQLQEALTNRYGSRKFSDTLVSRWMIENLYADGERREWTERVRHATGKSLETGPFLRKLSIDLHRLEEETPMSQ